MLNRIERHDVINAVALAVALLFCLYVMLRWFGYLGDTWSGGVFEAEKIETISDEDLAELAAEVAVVGAKPPNEVNVRVANASDGRDGLAGRGSERLAKVGYGTLNAVNKDGDPVDENLVYYVSGFRPDALQIAGLLGLPESSVQPLPSDSPGVSFDGADVIVILGNTAPV